MSIPWCGLAAASEVQQWGLSMPTKKGLVCFLTKAAIM